MTHTLEVTNNYGITRELEVNYVDTASDRDEFGHNMHNGDFYLEEIFYKGVDISSKLSGNYEQYLLDLLAEELY